MQELVGRLTTLDPAASESLKVVAYFDALLEARTGRTALLRAAARMTGCPAGCRLPGETSALRVAPEGGRLPDGPVDGWPSRTLPGGGRVWVERGTVQHPAEQMVLERLALAVGLVTGQALAGHAVHPAAVLVDPLATEDERADAAERLRLRETDQVRAVAAAGGTPAADALAQTATPWGRVRVALLRSDGDWADADWSAGPAGIGVQVCPAELPSSWSSALVALRSRRPDEQVVHADALGALVALVQAMDSGQSVPTDVLVVEQLQADPATARTLDALVDQPSLRASAGVLRLHHSTLQARVDQLNRSLGFDLSTPHGRTRLDLALALTRVRRAKFDG